jgi:hypothetical protein
MPSFSGENVLINRVRRFMCSRMARTSEVAAARHGPPARASLRLLRWRTAVPIGGDPVSRVIGIAPRPVRRRRVRRRRGVRDQRATNPAAEQSAHRRPANPSRRRHRQAGPAGRSCHAANGSAERNGRLPPARVVGFALERAGDRARRSADFRQEIKSSEGL